jgi:arsenate reductase
MDDPAAYAGPEERKIWAFRRAYRELENRIRIFASLPLASLDELSLRKRVAEIGALPPPPESEADARARAPELREGRGRRDGASGADPA